MLSLQKSHEKFSKYYDRPESVKARHSFRTTTTNYVMLAVSKILFMHSIFAVMIAKGEGEGLSCKRSTVALLHLVISSTLSPSYTGRRRPPTEITYGRPTACARTHTHYVLRSRSLKTHAVDFLVK